MSFFGYLRLIHNQMFDCVSILEEPRTWINKIIKNYQNLNIWAESLAIIGAAGKMSEEEQQQGIEATRFPKKIWNQDIQS